MTLILVPAADVQDWRQLLADPTLHWKPGYSAHSFAHSWQEARGFPASVQRIIESSGAFPDVEALLVLPEHKVSLPGGRSCSQSDAWVLARWRGGLVSGAIEGKCSESFGPTLGEWGQDASPGKEKRLAFLLHTLGLRARPSDDIGYQLLHRTASALIEAKRFHAGRAMMLVHSFSPQNEGFPDYSRFVELFGVSAEIGRLAFAGSPGGVDLYVGWVTEVG